MARPLALVTGASAGIGNAFARGLATRGYDLVVVARDTARLDALAKELEAAHGGTVEVLGADLSDAAQLATVEARLADAARPVELVVNNAGFGTMGHFKDLPIDREQEEIALNVVALTRLTHAALPNLLERRTGGVINVASIAAFQPTPGNATYGATKAFVFSLSQGIHEELRGTGVNCMVLCPGFTRTEFQQRAGIDSTDVPGFLWQEADTVVDFAMKAFASGKAVCVPGALNRVTAGFSATAPSGLTRRIAGAIVKRAEK
jgi:short-subunit dehydrogenase